MARVRSYSNGTQVGQRTRKFNGVIETRTVQLGDSVCTDFLGRDSDHPFDVVREVMNYPLISGDFGTVLSGYIYDGYPTTSSGYNLSTFPSAGSIEPDDVFSATAVAGQTNPTRPSVSVPLLLFETIRELPKMVFERGAELFVGSSRADAKRFGRKKKPDPLHSNNSVLDLNFGWEPLFRDVAALFDFAEHVDERVKELAALYSGRGLRRSRTVWTDTSTTIGGVNTLHSQGGIVQGYAVKVATRKKWVSTRWKPKSLHSIPSAAEQVQRARYLVHGWEVAPSDIWNALPFSWLADYFGNIGDFLAATRNSSEFELVSCCVMRRATLNVQVRITGASVGLTVTPATGLADYKHRVLGSIGLTANVPIVSGRRLLNLLALATNYSDAKRW